MLWRYTSQVGSDCKQAPERARLADTLHAPWVHSSPQYWEIAIKNIASYAMNTRAYGLNGLRNYRPLDQSVVADGPDAFAGIAASDPVPGS